MSGIVVVDQRSDWPVDIPGILVVSAWDYLTHETLTRAKRTRVYNLCRSFSYQSTGYYVSLLAGARGHKPLPEITTIQDLKLAESPRIINDEIEELIQHSLARIGSSEYLLNVYFGESLAKRHERLARALFNQFPAPLLQVKFAYKGDEWRVESINPVALGEVPAAHHEFLF
ncbi:MAG TPA: RimK-like ATPgrasp N-terminal domain-containing protein, partial [Solimonas sp.]|nr:RimK-like ATPgrasp N-terminal domain-containing protein [Solimonas sp.]